MSALTAGLRQPDARSCGAASVVMARLLREGRTPTPPEFREEVLERHRALTAARLHGHLQAPWPRALGTPPWALARELEALTGRDHVVLRARGGRAAGRAYDRLAAAGGALYVGSRALPRHVLLALPTGPAPRGVHEALRCYQPSRGTVVVLSRTEFVEHRLREAGWPHPWLAVTPAAPA